MSHIREIHNNFDVVFKEALMLYKNQTLDFLGLDLAMIALEHGNDRNYRK